MTPRRRIGIALALSLLAHGLAIVLAPKPPRHGSALSASAGPLIVSLAPSAPPPEPVAVPVPAPQPKPEARPPPPRPRAPAKPIITARPRTPSAAPPVATAPEEPRPVPPTPAPDMLAMLNARRERRRAAETAAAREGTASEQPAQDEGAAAIARNLETLKGDDQTGGIFQILDKSTLSAEYAFNGWRPDTRRRWREVIEVHVEPGQDIDRAIIRSMIALIRTHYGGDFQWESRRLGRIVTLSARPEDNEGLEDFLMREFFGTPLINRGNR